MLKVFVNNEHYHIHVRQALKWFKFKLHKNWLVFSLIFYFVLKRFRITQNSVQEIWNLVMIQPSRTLKFIIPRWSWYFKFIVFIRLFWICPCIVMLWFDKAIYLSLLYLRDQVLACVDRKYSIHFVFYLYWIHYIVISLPWYKEFIIWPISFSTFPDV